MKPLITKALEVLTGTLGLIILERTLVEQIGIFVMKLINAALEIWNGFIAIIGWLMINSGHFCFCFSEKIIEIICGARWDCRTT